MSFRVKARVTTYGSKHHVTALQKHWTWRAIWFGKPPPTDSEVLAAWREQTNSGRRKHEFWERSERDEAYERRVVAYRNRNRE